MDEVTLQDWTETFKNYSNTSLTTCAFILMETYFDEIENITLQSVEDYSEESFYLSLQHATLMEYIASGIEVDNALSLKECSNLSKIRIIKDELAELIYLAEHTEDRKKRILLKYNSLINEIYAMVNFEGITKWLISTTEGRNLLPPTLIKYIEGDCGNVPAELFKQYEEKAKTLKETKRKKLLCYLYSVHGLIREDIASKVGMSTYKGSLANVTNNKKEGRKLAEELGLPNIDVYE